MPIANKTEAAAAIRSFLNSGDKLMLDSPKLHEVLDAILLFATEDSLPNGVIIAQVNTATRPPDGWLLCDGTNGTPDLSLEPLRYIMKSSIRSEAAASR